MLFTANYLQTSERKSTAHHETVKDIDFPSCTLYSSCTSATTSIFVPPLTIISHNHHPGLVGDGKPIFLFPLITAHSYLRARPHSRLFSLQDLLPFKIILVISHISIYFLPSFANLYLGTSLSLTPSVPPAHLSHSCQLRMRCRWLHPRHQQLSPASKILRRLVSSCSSPSTHLCITFLRPF